MNPYPSRFGATVTINMKCLCAFGLGWASRAMWPETAEWWGLAVLSIMSAVASFILAVDALKLMGRVYSREKAIRAYMALGRAPKSSEMASSDQLEKAGMR